MEPVSSLFEEFHLQSCFVGHIKAKQRKFHWRTSGHQINTSMPFKVVWVLLFASMQTLVGGVDDRNSTLSLCCPSINTKLAKISKGPLRSPSFACVPQISNEDTTQTVSYESETDSLHHVYPVYGLGVGEVQDTNSNILAQCENQILQRFPRKESIKIPFDACVMGTEDEIISISCPQDIKSTRKISFGHKCCPHNYIYDSNQHKCVLNPLGVSNFHLYQPFFKTAAVFNDNPIDCARDKVLVEYKVNQYKISLINGRLYLRPLNKVFESNQYCIEAIDNIGSSPSLSEQEFLVRTCDDVSTTCRRMPCIRRCCNDGEMFSKGNATSYCRRDESDTTYHSFESLEISGNFTKPPVFGVLRSLDCSKYRLDPDAYADEAHTISERDGSLFVAATRKHYTNNQYCVEKIRNATWADQKLYTFLCFDTKVVGNDRIRFKLYTIGLLISCSFYAATLVVYLSISRLRNLPGKILICLVSSLFTAYLGIALGQLMPTPNETICFASGFFIYFCLMAAFSWMNVTCFDIWQTFGSAKKKHHTFKSSQNKRFLWYSLYGWGLPTAITVITVTLTKSDVLSDNIRPNFGHGRCWFTYDSAGSANLLFFSGPVGILFLINLILFILTLRYCNRVKREIFRMQSSNAEKPIMRRRFFVDKARFAMNTKLFVVMGITWFLELLSIIFYDHKKIFFWAISDSFNVLLGVSVFFIFVFKKRVWHSVLEKIGLRPAGSMKNVQTGTMSTYTHNNISMNRLNAIDGNASLLSPNAARRVPTI
ncbi:G-protein coupled receptor Mth2 [Stomoxys calcitrans]|uniref:G-protein coupled receptor Mth2 n=1 Tax=Stomoxys calcitrans TaxID=35570 RepID=UPI0027E306BD|nr:G-protein coupled receptor Mth2 [Stomoxys calcitrans]